MQLAIMYVENTMRNYETQYIYQDFRIQDQPIEINYILTF